MSMLSLPAKWAAAGFKDTELGVSMKPEVDQSIRSSCAGLSSRGARVGTYNVEATSAERQEDSVIAIS